MSWRTSVATARWSGHRRSRVRASTTYTATCWANCSTAGLGSREHSRRCGRGLLAALDGCGGTAPASRSSLSLSLIVDVSRRERIDWDAVIPMRDAACLRPLRCLSARRRRARNPDGGVPHFRTPRCGRALAIAHRFVRRPDKSARRSATRAQPGHRRWTLRFADHLGA